MAWVVEITGPGEKENRVEFSAFSRGKPRATVNGESSWESKFGAERALEEYRQRRAHEIAVEAGQLDLFGDL